MALTNVNVNNVISWEGRSTRTRKAPKTYWEEYVQTDEWYAAKLLEDVPADEYYAAIEDSDFSSDTDPIAPGAMWDFELSDENLTDTCEDESGDTGDEED